MTAKIIVVGGGFGGLEAAFSLKTLVKKGDITLIDRSSYHSFIPSIHLVVSGKMKPDEIRIPLKTILGTSGIRFVQADVLSIDGSAGEVKTDRESISYDYLVLACGATNNFFGIPGADRFSYRFRTPDDADRIRQKLLALMKEPARCRIMVAGAGTEGVEVIGEVLDLIECESMTEELQSGRITIELIEGRSRLLPSFPLQAQNRVEGYLRERGVSLIAGDRITEVNADGVILSSGQRHAASILIWSGGIQPSKLIRDLPFSKDPWGWLKVNDRLQVSGADRIFAVGDAVSVYTSDGPLDLQRLAYHAQDQARIAALNIFYADGGKKQVAYSPVKKPQLISIGKDMGIFAFEERVYSGAWVVSLKKAVERKHLMTYLTKPVSAAIWSRLPGAGLMQRMRTRLPI